MSSVLLIVIVTHDTHCHIKTMEIYLHLDNVENTVMTGLKGLLIEQTV